MCRLLANTKELRLFRLNREPLDANVTGETAYVVASATMTLKVHGKRITQSGATFTVALRNPGEDWRIAAWAWAKGTPKTGGYATMIPGMLDFSQYPIAGSFDQTSLDKEH